jgi:hypothetical protein
MAGGQTKTGAKGRKISRNRDKCARYRGENRKTLNKLRAKQTRESRFERRAIRRMDQAAYPASDDFTRALKRLRNTIKRKAFIDQAEAQRLSALHGAACIKTKRETRLRLRRMNSKDRALAKSRGLSQFAQGPKFSQTHFNHSAPRSLRDA